MSRTSPDISSLSRTRVGTTVPMPSRKWRTRVFLPLAVLCCAGGVLAYAARGALLSAIPVRVVPVIQKDGGAAPTPDASSNPASAQPAAPDHAPQKRVLVQAPGWVEPDPYAVTVPALAEGVIRDLLIVEGQSVQAGEVLARMVDEDAKLALRRADAEVQEREADVARAAADLAAAAARTDELRDDLTRKRPLVERGAIGAAELTQLELRVRAAERGIAAAEGMAALARAAESRARVMRDEAALALDRMEIRAPSAGIVMKRLVEPGMRISMGSGSAEGMTVAVARLYDPAKLQVRVDVPISDAGKVAVGDEAEIVTDALPDTVFKGTVVRAVHEANIQRNTVQFKVAIADPSPTLKPEMLMRVRLLGAGSATGISAAPAGPASHARDHAAPDPAIVLLLPESAIAHRMGDAAHIWLIDQTNPSKGPIVRMTEIGLAPAEEGLLRVTRGLRPGDRVVVDAPPTLTDGARVTIIGEQEEH